MIDGNTRLYGIIGQPVAHSLSPAMHNRAFEQLQFNAAYLPLPLTELKRKTVETLFQCGFHGFSVTIPFKTAAAKLADSCDDLTRISQAANTLVRTKKGIHAVNTDGPGALRALKESLPALEGLSYLIIGYGGSAAGLAHALLLSRAPARLYLTGRNLPRARKLLRELQAAHGNERVLFAAAPIAKIAPEEIDVIINTTPQGLEGHDNSIPLPAAFLRPGHTVFDIVYRPLRTPLLIAAGRAGARTIPGYTMLLYQAVLQNELFTGQKAPVALMEKVLLKALKAR